MSQTEMPATEAHVEVDEQELASYELAYHVLPTVADGEVSDVRDRVAASITKVGGEITDEEMPQHFDLVYDIDKYLEGKHRKFSSAYFGWIRFRANRADIEAISHDVDVDKSLLRYLLIRLTKEEEAMPFYFHQERIQKKKVETVGEEGVTADIDPNKATGEEVDVSGIDEESKVTTTDATPDAADTSDAPDAAPETEESTDTDTKTT